MKIKDRRPRGFTVIELMIVVLVVAALIAIVFSTYSGIEAKNRNSRRQTAIVYLQSQIESFYSQNDYYPSLGDMNSANWRKSNMPNLNVGSMIDPSSKMTTADAVLSAKPSPKIYSYQVSDSAGSSCEGSKDVNCAQYTLTATYEGTVNGSKTYTKSNID